MLLLIVFLTKEHELEQFKYPLSKTVDFLRLSLNRIEDASNLALLVS